MLMITDQQSIHWTNHARRKMMQYRLSESRVKRVLRHPARREVGVAEDTVAGMQPAGSTKHPYEIWAMWQEKVKSQKSKVKSKFNKPKQIIIISAWRYPGVSPIGEPPPIPEEVWAILKKTKR